ncbi:nucleoside diphosphate-linked moiety X motif 22-like [Elysia marginata]|uniref:Nucleoside diphosphate-linked moiety X motif 22-like n=1 Tax=Elysia marginata TaxID=1093978 RepID=A0AAV4JK98_9GAST|nr:nucleoside diphosphate-linked moiety X motif 22-like [Elysia marginata]
MDPDIKIMHVVQPLKLQPQSCVKVCLSSDYNRKHPLADTYMHSEFQAFGKKFSVNREADPVDIVWEDRVKENPRLFNATKFRIHSVETVDDNEVLMSLGVTDYKEFLGTNWAPHAQFLQSQGEELHGNSQIFLSDALGVGASVITSDDFLIFLCRSEHCAEAPGTYDVPGGHAEPKEIIGDVPLKDISLSSFDCGKVVHEIFDSILREVTDEVNIPRQSLSAPLYTGTHRNLTSAGRPSVAFEIKCALSREEVLNLYRKGNQSEADESTNILFVPWKEIPNLDSSSPELWNKMAPSAKGNLTVLCMAYGVKSF